MWERPIHNGHGRVPGIRRLQILWMPGMEMGIVIQVNKKNKAHHYADDVPQDFFAYRKYKSKL
jgi:hypothetical protein